MEMQLEDSSNRIGNTRANAEQIIHHLQQLINEQKHESVFTFSWNLKMYRYPPKKGEKTFEFSPQQLAIIEQVHMDNALKRTHNLEPCVLFNQLPKVETSHFLIVKCAKDTDTPFFTWLKWWAIMQTIPSPSSDGHQTHLPRGKGGSITIWLLKHRQQNTKSQPGKEVHLCGASNHTSTQSSTTQYTLGFWNKQVTGNCLQKCSENLRVYPWFLDI